MNASNAPLSARGDRQYLFVAVYACRAILAPAFMAFLLALLVGEAVRAQALQPIVQAPEHFDVSAPLREMPADEHRHNTIQRIPWRRTHPVQAEYPRPEDAARQATASPLVSAVDGSSFDGVADVNGVVPPDTNMAVGPNHLIHWVNLSYAVYDKLGNLLPGYPKSGDSIWAGFGGPCDPSSGVSNGGDIIAQYDVAHDRWVLSQLARTGGPTYYHCIAVSTSGDPTGSYYRYSFSFADLNDYPKMTVWPDAYYASYNMFANGATFVGPRACAYDAAAMRAGTTANQICFQLGNGVGSLLPSDLDGPTAPPSGSPNYYLNFNSDAKGNGSTLSLWKYHVDFATPANSTFAGPITIPVTPFIEACAASAGTCIPEDDVVFGTLLDSLGDRLMYRLAYRNFGDHESLVVNHAVTSGSAVGLRWYEIRSPGGTPSVFQQSTFDPGDGNFRWMGSAAMDRAGDIAIGYSLSGNSMYPAIAYTGRTPADNPNTLQSEKTVFNSSFFQLLISRWGDYTALRIDPSDDCTFWYTNEYINASGDWQTRIASFKFSNCSAAPPPLPPTLTSATAVSATEIDLAWTNPAGTDATGNLVLRCTGNCVPNVQIASLAATATNYRDLSVSPSTTYSYLIQAVSSGGSSNSNTLSSTTPAPPAPAAPTLNTATAVSSTEIDLGWTNNATNATGIRVLQCVGASCNPSVVIASLAATATAYKNTGLAPSTSYTYRVEAFNSGGVGDSNTLTQTTQAPPPPPAAPVLTVGSPTKNSLTLHWTESSNNVSSFDILRCKGTTCTPTTQIASVAGTVASYKDTGLSRHSTYRYLVRANNSGGSALSNIASGTTN
jgi:hypothetical protein